MPIESATPCHEAEKGRLYRASNPVRMTVLAAKSEDYTTAPPHLQIRLMMGLVFGGGSDKSRAAS